MANRTVVINPLPFLILAILAFVTVVGVATDTTVLWVAALALLVVFGLFVTVMSLLDG